MSGNVTAFDFYILHKNLMLQGLSHFTYLLFFKKDKDKAVPLHAMWAHGGQQRYSSIHF
jgi:hypothetical protein